MIFYLTYFQGSTIKSFSSKVLQSRRDGLEKPAAAECWLQAVAFCLLCNDRNPGVCIRKEDNVGVVDPDELKEIGEDYFLRPLEPLLAFVEDLDTGDITRKVWISKHFHPQDAYGILEIGREPGLLSFSTREQVLLGQIPLILSDIHVVKLGSIAGLYLDLLGHFPAGVYPVALESAEDAIEAALFDPEPAFQSLSHLPMGMRIFQVHVKRRWIGGADPFKSSLAAPEFNAAL